MGTTIKEIAEQADVSIATVSLVLNNKRGVGAATRKRILRLAEEMNYTGPVRTPISALKHGTIRFLKIARHGHIVNRDHNVFISDYLDGIIQTARDLKYKTEVASFRTTPMAEIIETIKYQSDLTGAIVLGTELNRDDVLAFRQVTLPIVFIDTFLDYVPFDFVDMNNIDSVFKIVEHFLEHGHRQIGIVRSRVATRNFRLRDKAFRDVMDSVGLALDARCVFDVDSTFEGAYHDMAEHLREKAVLPTALFCTNDIIAFGVLKALREYGVRVPEEVSVVGFDDLPTAALLDPPLTSIAVSKREIGATAMRRLDERIRDDTLPVNKIVVEGALVRRSSVMRVGEPVRVELRDPDQG